MFRVICRLSAAEYQKVVIEEWIIKFTLAVNIELTLFTIIHVSLTD